MRMGRKERSKMIASCGFLEEELRQCSKEDGNAGGRHCGNAGSPLENQKSLGAKEKEDVQDDEILDH